MSILAALEHALGRRAELAEYAEKVEHVVEDLAGRVGKLEAFMPASTPEPTTPAEQDEPGQA